MFQIINFTSKNSKWKKYNLSIDDKFDALVIFKKIIDKLINYYEKNVSYEDIISHYEKIKKIVKTSELISVYITNLDDGKFIKQAMKAFLNKLIKTVSL